MEVIEVVVCIDKNWLITLPAFINSIDYHITNKWRLNILCPSGEQQEFENFLDDYDTICRVGQYQPNEISIKYCKFRKRSLMNLSRFFIRDVFPDLEKIIYLDTDMLILDDLTKLWNLVNLNAKNGYYAAAIDLLPNSLLYINNPFKNIDLLLNWKRHHNGGLFVTNLKYWDQPINELYSLINRDLKNKIFKGLFSESLQNLLFPNFFGISPKWNLCGMGQSKIIKNISLFKSKMPTEKPHIIHWSGPFKPWSHNSVPFYQEWNKFNKYRNKNRNSTT